MRRTKRKDIRAKVIEIVTFCHESSADISSFSDELLSKLKIVERLSITEQKNTSIYHALVVMALCKIICPKQDIRKCQACMRGGFSARTFEQKYVLETLTSLGLALRSDSAWLTRSLLRETPYNRNYKANFNGGDELRIAFLEIVDSIQNKPECNQAILSYLFGKVSAHKKERKVNVERPKETKVNVEKIASFVDEQMSFDYGCKGGARFCEIACLSMMKVVAPQVKKYRDCEVGDLNSPCACDKSLKSSGDVELHDRGRLVLSIETKLNISIDSMIVMKAEKKIEKHRPADYWIVLYSKDKNCNSCGIQPMIDRIHENYGCQILILEMISWLRQFLCILDDPAEFLNEYLDAIEKDEYLMKVHKEKTSELILKHFGNVANSPAT